MKFEWLISFLLCVLLVSSCADKKGDPIPLKADAGADQSALPFTTVTLDGSASTGSPDIRYEWKYSGSVPESQISFNDITLPKATFIPSRNGVYTFTLRVTQGSQFNEDQVVVTVSGTISLSGTLATSLELKDIEPGTGPDYRITSDVIIPSGVLLTLPDKGSSAVGNVVIEIDESAGIIVDGGTFRMQANNQLTLKGASGWKGILVKNGLLQLVGGARIEKAAKSAFSGQSETAAITATGGSITLSSVTFTASTGYDLLIPAFLTGAATVESNVFSASKPLKVPVSMLGRISVNSYTEPYDYITVTTPGAAVTVSENVTFRNSTKYYLDGDYTAGSAIVAQSASGSAPTYIYVKAGSGIVASGGVNFGSNIIFDGLSGAPWKGLAISGGSSGNTIGGIKVLNAGSAVFNTGSFTSDVKAAIYYFSNAGNAGISNSEIKDSQGYGIYNATAPFIMTATNCTFTNTASAAISAPIDYIHAAVGTGNAFTMTSGIAAVDVRVPNLTTSPTSTWNSLGGSNYYLFSNNARQSGGSWIVAAGTQLRFKAGKYLDLEQGAFTAIGTSTSAITFDSETGATGKWSGILVQGTSKFEYCQIKNGGELAILKGGVTPATEKANIVFNYGGIVATNTFKNNTVTGSAGYGLLVEAGKQNPDAANVANNNTFTSNTSGSIIVK